MLAGILATVGMLWGFATAHDGHVRGVVPGFSENKGQWRDEIRFRADLPACGRLFLENDALTYVFLHPDDVAALHPRPDDESPHVLRGHAYKVRFLNAQTPAVSARNPRPGYENYFLGADSSRWASGVRSFAAVTYAGLWPGVDLDLYVVDGGIKYDFRLRPGVDPSVIQMRYEGADGLEDDGTSLRVRTAVGTFVERIPRAYYEDDGRQTDVACRYRVSGDVVGFEIKERRPDVALVIDPEVVFATYTGSFADNWGFTATYDEAGFAYSGGIVSGAGYPSSAGAFQVVFGGGVGIYITLPSGGQYLAGEDSSLYYESDAAIIKFSPDGTQRVWATYLGGTRNDQPHSMMVDGIGRLFLMGATRSNNFPVTGGAFQTNNRGNIDMFVSCLSADGATLVASTYVGGGDNDGVNQKPRTLNPLHYFYADDARGEILLNGAGEVFVVSSTKSTNFPVTQGAFQTTFGGRQDGVVFKLAPNLATMLWGSYMGGNRFEAGYSIKTAPNGTIYVVGGTNSPNFPVGTGGLNPNYLGGDADGFILNISADGSQILRGTHVGTDRYDQTHYVDLDAGGNVYVTGQSDGAYPVVNAAYSVPQSGQYITKFNPGLNAIVWSTGFGDNDSDIDITTTAFLVDQCENVYVSGWGSSAPGLNSGSTFGLPVSSDAYRTTTNGSDFYLFILERDATNLFYATFFGGSNSADHVDGGTSRFDKRGVVYQAICGSCGGSSDIPTTPGAFSAQNNSDNCNNAVVKFRIDLINPTLAQYVFDVSSNQGCAPYTVQFTNQSINATEFYWDFGDGNNSTVFAPTHTFANAGVYTVRLRAANPGLCNMSDETTRTIYVYARTEPDFAVTVTPCGQDVQVQNLTQNGTTYLWRFGDGTTSPLEQPGAHVYPGFGEYVITLVVNPNSPCSDSVRKTVRLGAPGEMSFAVEQAPCETTINFNGTAASGVTVRWEFGDGTPAVSNVFSTSHTFPGPGSYLVRFIGQIGANPLCADTVAQTVAIRPPSVADFADYPLVCQRAASFVFTGSMASTYFWDVGDGTTYNLSTPFQHTFLLPGTYTVTLITDAGTACADTAVRVVTIPPLPRAAFEKAALPCETRVNFQNQSIGQSFFWDFGDGATSTEAEPTHEYSGPGVYLVRLVANPDGDCPDAADKIVVVSPPGRADFLAPETSCKREIGFWSVSSHSFSYRWDFGDGTTAYGPYPEHTYLAPGTYTVTLWVNEGTPCADSMQKTLTILPPVKADFDVETLPCDSRAWCFNRSTGGEELLWTTDDGQTSSEADPVFLFASEGVYKIALILNPSSPCPVTKEKWVYVDAPPSAELLSPSVACELTPSLTFLLNKADVVRYRVGAVDETITSPASPLTLNFSFDAPGDHILTLELNPGRACDTTLTYTITIPALAGAAADVAAEPCSFTVDFSSERSRNAREVLWYVEPFLTDRRPRFSHTFSQTGEYVAMLVVNPDTPCPDTAYASFRVGKFFTTDFTTADAACNGVARMNNLSPPELDYVWDFGDGATSTDYSPTHVYGATGSYTVILTAEQGTGCETTVEKTLFVPPPVDAAFSIRPEACGPSVTFENLTQGRVAGAKWDFGDGTGGEQTGVFDKTYAQEGTYTVSLTVRDLHGCEYTVDTTFVFDPLGDKYLRIPNVFTPNNDGLNDCFEIKAARPDCFDYVEIYDRWGIRAFRSSEFDRCWDGTFMGGPVPEGAYVYVVRVGDFWRVGTVTVIR